MHVLDDIDCGLRLGQRGSVDHGRQAAPPRVGRDIGWREFCVGDTQQIVEQTEVFGVCVGELGAYLRPGLRGIEMVDSHAGAKHSRDEAEWHVAGVGFAVHSHDCGAPDRRERGGLAGQPALADPRWPDDVDDAPHATHRLVQDRRQEVQFPGAPDQGRLIAMARLMLLDGQQLPRPDRGVVALDRMQFCLFEQHRVFDQSGRRLTEHDPTGRRYRFHPLRHPDLFTDGGVTRVARTDFAGNDLTRIQPDAQLQGDAVAVHHISRERDGLTLDLQRGDAGTNRVVLQRHRRTEHRHDPVAGELVDGAAVALHHRRRAVEQFGHDLAQPLGAHRSGDVHRMHDIGEQTVTCLYSAGPRDSVTGAPHASQNRAFARSSMPQALQRSLTSISWPWHQHERPLLHIILRRVVVQTRSLAE